MTERLVIVVESDVRARQDSTSWQEGTREADMRRYIEKMPEVHNAGGRVVTFMVEQRDYPKVYVKGRGHIDRVGHDPNDRGTCGRCGSRNLKVENHSFMWHDGDIVCQDCGGYVRMFDAG